MWRLCSKASRSALILELFVLRGPGTLFGTEKQQNKQFCSKRFQLTSKLCSKALVKDVDGEVFKQAIARLVGLTEIGKQV